MKGLNNKIRVLNLNYIKIPFIIYAIYYFKNYYLKLLDKDKDNFFKFYLNYILNILKD